MIKNNLAVLMAERGLKIIDLYNETGISKTTLMSIADNKGKGIQYDTLDKLCNYFGVSINDFFIYTPYMFTVSYFDTETFEFLNNEIKNKNSHRLNDLAITVKYNNNEVVYPIFVYASSNDYCLVPFQPSNNADFTILLTESDAYDNGETTIELRQFFKIFNQLAPQFQFSIMNDIVKMITDNLINLSESDLTIRTNDGLEEYQLKGETKIAIISDIYNFNEQPLSLPKKMINVTF